MSLWHRIASFLKGERPVSMDEASPAFRTMITGSGFAGSAVNRLTYSLAQSSSSVNTDLDGALVILRARARSLAVNNEFARRFLSLVATNIVGPCGPKLQVRATKVSVDSKGSPLDKSANDAIEIHWDRWGSVADITGRMTLAHMGRVAIKGVARDGEALIRKVRRRDLPYGLQLQLLEADRLDESMNQRLSNGNVIRQGIELDTTLRPIAYWVKTAHPGESYIGAPPLIERVPASDIIHLYLPERAEQVRGYTWMHAVLMRMAMLHGYEENAVVAARIGASKIAALTREPEAPLAGAQMADAKDAQGNLQINAEAGDILELPPGYKLESWDPQYPHENFESFVKQCLRGMSSGCDVAAHNLSGDMTDVTYSSARIAELSERETWIVLQGWLIHALYLPLYREWLASALLRGDITFDQSGKSLPADKLDKFSTAARFQGRRWSWVDPLKEADAAGVLIELGLSSRTELAAAQGREFEDIVAELKQEKDALEAAGLPGVYSTVNRPISRPPGDERK